MESSVNGVVSSQSISVHDFSEKILEQRVHFHVMRLNGGFFLWIGTDSRLQNLALAIGGKHDSIPLSTLVLGDSSDTSPNSLAQRLALKTGKQVFVSYNLPVTESSLMLQVENRIKQEMQLHPDKF
ncbi:hypothetical protein DNTS_032290 [Danionella cerebrum]|uniref:Proteasome assembly chaperone 4 n=1 Tax=Danionella cerebrum TaxID=2873325 RepID=A0A553QGD8_9TELE|nr:hypothetical protein DNTS_032290 [Danionella translucida]